MEATRVEVAATRTLPRWSGPVSVGIGALAACTAAAVIDPYRGQGVPCPFHMVTGLWCPVCGSTRALHSLLRGDLQTAFSRNPLLIVLLPLLAVSWAAWMSDAVGGPRLWRLPRNRWVLVTLLVVVGLFWIARNLPFAPLRVLGP